MVVSDNGDRRQSMTGDFNRLLMAGLAVLVAFLGTAIPISVYRSVERRQGDYMREHPPFAYLVFVACLAAFVLCKLGASVLARQAARRDQGEVAAMEERTQKFIRTVRNTAFICAPGPVLGVFLLELVGGNGEGAFFALVVSPFLALVGGLFGIFVRGWLA